MNSKVDKAAAMIWNNAEGDLDRWQDESDWFWFWMLIKEVVELGLAVQSPRHSRFCRFVLALLGWQYPEWHKYPELGVDIIESKLQMIGGIIMNWLRKKYRDDPPLFAKKRQWE